MIEDQTEIQELILKAIQDGEWRSGERLPSTVDFAARMGLKSRAVHYALSALAARGYLERKQGVGTIVRKKRRISNAVMLVGFNLHLEFAHSNRLLVEMTREELQRRGYGLVVLDNIFAASTGPYAEYRGAIERLKQQLITADPIGYLEIGCYLNRFPELYADFKRPTVRFARTLLGGDVHGDNQAFTRTSLEHFAKSGRRKLAVLRPANANHLFFLEDDFLWQCVDELGFLRCQIREVIGNADPDLERHGYELASSLVEEWKSLRKNYVPDCLLVTDDVMMRGVAAALLKSHIDVPRDLEIISLANEGVPVHFGLPVNRYEVSRKAAAKVLVDLFEARVGKFRGPPFPVNIPGRLRLASEFR